MTSLDIIIIYNYTSKNLIKNFNLSVSIKNSPTDGYHGFQGLICIEIIAELLVKLFIFSKKFSALLRNCRLSHFYYKLLFHIKKAVEI